MALAADRGQRVTGTAQAMESLRDQTRPALARRSPARRAARRAHAGAQQGVYSHCAHRRSRSASAPTPASSPCSIKCCSGRSPFDEPERLVQVAWQGQRGSARTTAAGALLSYPICRELEQQREIFDGVLCRHPTNVNLSTGRDHESMRAEIVSGVVLQLAARASRAGPPHPSVRRSATWRASGGGALARLLDESTERGAADIVGRRVLVNSSSDDGHRDRARALSRRRSWPAVPAVWIPAMMKRQATPEWDGLNSRRTFWVHAIGRLRPERDGRSCARATSAVVQRDARRGPPGRGLSTGHPGAACAAS